MTAPQPPATIQPIDKASPDAQSANLVEGNLAQLKALFPEAFTEGRVDFEVLKQLLGAAVDEREEKYGLNWHGKRRARQLALTPSTGTLRPCPEESVDWDTTQNLFIEGDNLEVLKLLQKSYAGKVKLIYIDPPYNTGKDFVYPDNFQDSIKNYLELTGQVEGGQKISSNTDASGRFHTDWLNMMYPRLRLARDILRNDGVIFVSIDDSESANLKHLLSDIFGEENFIDTIAVEMSTTSGPKTVNAQQGTIVKNIEFVHIFRKSAQFDAVPHQPLFDGVESYDTHYSAWMNEDGTIQPLVSAMLQAPEVRADIERLGVFGADEFGINDLSKLLVTSSATKDFIEKNARHIARLDRAPVSATGVTTPAGRWVAFEADHRTYYLTSLSNGTLQALIPLSLNFRMSDDYKPRYGRTVIRGDLWKGFYQDMGNVAKEGDIPFANGKKPVRLIKQLIKWAGCGPGEIILDFFGGSGTTGHATMELNSEDSSSRRFIVVQLPEQLDAANPEQKAAAMLCDELGRPRSLSELTKERLKRSARKLKVKTPNLDAGFRTFKLDGSNIRAWNPRPDDLTGTLLDHAEHLAPGRSEQDVLYELLLKLGLDLAVPMESRQIAGKTVHSIGAGALLACLSDGIDRDVAEPLALGIAAWQKAQAQALQGGDDNAKPVSTKLVFKDSAFADDVAKTNLGAILSQHGLDDVRSI